MTSTEDDALVERLAKAMRDLGAGSSFPAFEGAERAIQALRANPAELSPWVVTAVSAAYAYSVMLIAAGIGIVKEVSGE
jgi:hypothetical protein